MLQARLLVLSLASVASAALLSACVVAPYPQRVVYAQPIPAVSDTEPGGVVVDVPPPAPYVEVVPPVPFAGAIWLGGYWGWNGGRHAWVPGRWDHPRPGYGWRPHAWVQQGGRWHLHQGGWERR
jgi:hypothetical protein